SCHSLLVTFLSLTLTINYSTLLLQSLLHPSPLHSFPTRRSSDLSSRRQCIHWQKDSHTDHNLPPERQNQSARVPVLPDTRAGSLDRKSTRLNSSHVSISYAVFCLKKKNISEMRKCSNVTRHLLSG